MSEIRKFSENLTAKLNLEVKKIGFVMGSGNIAELQQLVDLYSEAFSELKQFTIKYEFENEAEEIFFFKEIKPSLVSRRLLYNFILDTEIYFCKAPSSSTQKEYLQMKMEEIASFHKKNSEYSNYYITNKTDLDHQFFVREGKIPHLYQPVFFQFEHDDRFSTGIDSMHSLFLAYDAYKKYVDDEINKLRIKINGTPTQTPLFWTLKPIQFVELIYALYASKALNHGEVQLKKIIVELAAVLGINLKTENYASFFTKIKGRKKGEFFLDELKTALLGYMTKKRPTDG